MDIARYKILKSKRHIKKQVHWWFYVQEYVCMVNLLTKTILQIVYKKICITSFYIISSTTDTHGSAGGADDVLLSETATRVLGTKTVSTPL